VVALALALASKWHGLGFGLSLESRWPSPSPQGAICTLQSHFGVFALKLLQYALLSLQRLLKTGN